MTKTNRRAGLPGTLSSVALAALVCGLPACPKHGGASVEGSVGATGDATGDATPAPSAPLSSASSRSAPPVGDAAEAGRGASAAATAPCSGEGYGPGPELAAVKGLPAFAVPFRCLWPSHQRLEISVALSQKATRSQVEALLRALWKQLQTSMGAAFPETVKLCVLAPGTSASALDASPLGCMRKGYEPEGEPGEEEADLRVDMPLEPAELAAQLTASFAKRFAGANRARVAFDEARGELSIVYPYVEEGTDRWASAPSYADVALPFFRLAWGFYPPKTALSALAFQGVWKGKTLMQVRLGDLKAFLAMDPWGVRDRLGAARVPLEPGAARTAEQDAAVRHELEAALAKLPPGSVVQGPRSP